MVTMVIELLVVFLMYSPFAACRKLGYNPCLAQVDVLDVVAAKVGVPAVGVVAPHLVEVERLALSRVLGRPLTVLAVGVVHRVLRVAR